MAWIESHQSLSRHRKTLRAAALLKVDRHKLLGHLHELWWWGLDNADIYGMLPECTYGEIAEAAGWPAKDGDRFVEALLAAGFVDRDDMQRVELSLHDWYEFAGKWMEQRAANKERMRVKRGRTTDARAEHVQRTTDARGAHVSNTTDARAGATGPDLTGPNRSTTAAAAAGALARETAPTKADLIRVGKEARNHASG